MTIRLDAHLPEFHRGAPPQLPVRCATTANVTVATGLNAGDTVDGLTLAAGDRVLLKSQSAGAENGVYIAGATPARAYDMAEGVAAWGALVYVIAGTANGGKVFVNTNATLPTIGTTALTWTEFASGSALTISDEGTPLATAATTLDFVGAGVTATGTGASKTITIPGGGGTGGGTAPVFVGAKAYSSTTQSIPNITETTLLWDSEEIDTDGFHSTSSNTGRLTIPTSFGGTYLVVGAFEIGSNSTGERIIQVKKNGSTVVAYRTAIPPSAGLATLEVAVILQLAATDYVTLIAQQTSGSSLTVSGPVQVSSFSIAQLAVGTGSSVVAIPFLIDGGGATLTTGIKGDLSIPFACTVTGWRALGDQSGSVVVDTWKDTYAAFLAGTLVAGDSMWGGSKPTISSARGNEATGLSIAVAAGDVLRFNVDSVTTIQRVTLSLTATRT